MTNKANAHHVDRSCLVSRQVMQPQHNSHGSRQPPPPHRAQSPSFIPCGCSTPSFIQFCHPIFVPMPCPLVRLPRSCHLPTVQKSGRVECTNTPTPLNQFDRYLPCTTEHISDDIMANPHQSLVCEVGDSVWRPCHNHWMVLGQHSDWWHCDFWLCLTLP